LQCKETFPILLQLFQAWNDIETKNLETAIAPFKSEAWLVSKTEFMSTQSRSFVLITAAANKRPSSKKDKNKK
jgi:hypothetical protein